MVVSVSRVRFGFEGVRLEVWMRAWGLKGLQLSLGFRSIDLLRIQGWEVILFNLPQGAITNVNTGD